MLTDEQIDKVYREVWSMVAHAKRLAAFAHLIEAETRKEIAAAVLAEREACARACDGVAADLGGVAEGVFVTEFGKHTHQSMAAGAMNSAATIRQRTKGELNDKP